MATKVKGEAIKEGSIPLSALSDEVKDKIENAGGGATPDWNAREWEAGYIKNRTHSAFFGRIEYDQENNRCKYEVSGFEDKLLLLWGEKYFTVHKNIPLTIDVNDGEDTFIVNYNGTTLYITDNNGYLYDEHEYISVSETNIPLAEAFMPETVVKTTPQELSDTDKNQALANLGIDLIDFTKKVKIIIDFNRTGSFTFEEYGIDLATSNGILLMAMINYLNGESELESTLVDTKNIPNHDSEYSNTQNSTYIGHTYVQYLEDYEKEFGYEIDILNKTINIWGV